MKRNRWNISKSDGITMIKKCIVLCISVIVMEANADKDLKEFKWLNSKVGITSEVLSPWTSIEVKQKGKGFDIKVWGRAYEFNKGPFPSQIETKGKEILAGPIRIIAKSNGENISWEFGKFQIKKQTKDVVCFDQEVTGDGLILSANTQIEYDGMIRVDWKIVPQYELILEELTFEIPMIRKYAKYINYINYGPNKPGFLPDEGVVRNFLPMIWLGDEELGFQWFCESEKDWYIRQANRAIEVVPQENVVMLRLSLVNKPIHMKPGVRQKHELGIPIMQPTDNVVELEYTFGFQATPVKQIKEDVWDYRIFHLSPTNIGTHADRNRPDYWASLPESTISRLAKSGVKTIAIHLQWQKIAGAALTMNKSDDEALKKVVKDFHKYGIKVLLYQGFLISNISSEWNFFSKECIRIPINEWDATNRWMPMLPQKAYDVCYNSVWNDFLADAVEQMMKEYDIDGVYLDSTGSLFGGCNNTLHGCGYIRLDGKIHRTYQIFGNRKVMQRIYTIVKKYKQDGQVNLHQSAEMLMPVMSWATSYWNGEDIPGRVSEGEVILEKLPLDVFRTEYMGHQWGVAAEFLCYTFAYPQIALAISLLHDVPVRPSYFGELIYSVWELMDKFGRKESEWLPYWRNKEYVNIKSDGKDLYVSLYQHPKNRILAVVSNLGEKESELKIQFNLEKLKVSKISTNIIYEQKGDVLIGYDMNMTDGIFKLNLKSREFKIIWVK